MKIQKIRNKRVWRLSSGSNVLYQGYRSPWDHPEIIREAIATERWAQPAEHNTQAEAAPG